MSGGVKGVAGSDSRVSIPTSVKKTIDNIREITGKNHTEDEIYAVLKECSMDPNETTHKLLLLDTFQEVKKKRDRRKENLNEAAESKFKPGIQARPNRAGRGNYPSQYISHDASRGRNSVAAKENVSNLLQDKGNKGPLASAQEMKKKETSFVASSIGPVPNGSSSITSHGSNSIHDNHADPVLLLSQDLPLHSAVGPIQHEVGSERAPVKLIADSPTESKLPSAKNSAFEVESSNLPSLANDFHGVGKNQHLEPLLPESSASGGSITTSGPSSNHNNRSQVIGPQKVGPGKEWKPKAANSTVGHGVDSTVISPEPVKIHPESQLTPVVLTQKQDSLELLQRKLEESHTTDSEHVIIPNHLHVPEAEKLGFRFGSFDAASFGDLSHYGVPGSNLSQSSEAINEPVEEQQLSHQNALAAVEDTETKYSGQSQSPIQEPEKNSSSEVEISSSITHDYDESKQEVAPGTLRQHPVIHSSSNYNVGLMPPTLNGQLTPLESSESQAHDAPRFPGYIVPQSFDPASYYAQFYCSGMDSDGRTSPFLSAGAAANKYNGSVVVPQQPSQSPQEGDVPLVLSTSSQTQLATQPAGVVQSSLPTQQSVPVFRQPSGVHLPHFPPNYIPYGPYFSPYYIPPPTIHQFLSNGTFPQQPQPGNFYPTPTGTTAKYSVPQYKQGSNMGNATHIGALGPYGFSMANCASNSAAITSTSNDNLAASQVKENNIYVSGQQTEGSGVWFTTPSRDISTLPPTSFYNLPQGQLAFNPTQPGHGTFTGVFHPGQAAAALHPLFHQSQAITSPADMAGPTASVYQQQQHSQQMNWPSNHKEGDVSSKQQW